MSANPADATQSHAIQSSSTAAAFDILDVHTHLNDPSTLTGDQLEHELERRLQTMDARGVRQAVIAADHRYLRPDGIKDTRTVNDRVAAYRDAASDRFPAAVGIVEPLYGERGLDEIVRCRDELRMVGLSFHCRFQGVSTDSAWVVRYLEKMADLGMVPFLHCFGEAVDEALWRVESLAKHLPGTPMLVLDAFSTSDQARYALQVAERHPNLVFDTATARAFAPIQALISHVGASRLVYGSDLYSWPDSERVHDPLPELLNADLSSEDKDSVLGATARRLLHL